MRVISGRESRLVEGQRGGRISAEGAATAGRRAHGSAVNVLAQIHQGQKSAEDAGFQIVGESHAAGGDARQLFAVFRDEAHDFALAVVWSVAKSGFAAHLRTTGFQRQRVMENAELLLLESMRRVVLA